MVVAVAAGENVGAVAAGEAVRPTLSGEEDAGGERVAGAGPALRAEGVGAVVGAFGDRGRRAHARGEDVGVGQHLGRERVGVDAAGAQADRRVVVQDHQQRVGLVVEVDEDLDLPRSTALTADAGAEPAEFVVQHRGVGRAWPAGDQDAVRAGGGRRSHGAGAGDLSPAARHDDDLPIGGHEQVCRVIRRAQIDGQKAGGPVEPGTTPPPAPCAAPPAPRRQPRPPRRRRAGLDGCPGDEQPLADLRTGQTGPAARRAPFLRAGTGALAPARTRRSRARSRAHVTPNATRTAGPRDPKVSSMGRPATCAKGTLITGRSPSCSRRPGGAPRGLARDRRVGRAGRRRSRGRPPSRPRSSS
jgi:hypothetical protein